MRVRMRATGAGTGENTLENISIEGACCVCGLSMNLPLEICTVSIVYINFISISEVCFVY